MAEIQCQKDKDEYQLITVLKELMMECKCSNIVRYN